MTRLSTPRIAGLLYLCIIVLGIGSEGVLRLPYRADPGLAGSDPLGLHLSIMADIGMVLADVALALLLFALLRRFGQGLAVAAMVFRLVQAAGIIAGLNWLIAAVQIPEQAAAFLTVHGIGYDISLVPFALNCLLTGLLIRRAGARLLGLAIMASGAVYLTGTVMRVMAPDLADGFAAAYALPLLAESALCLWLLSGARRLN